MKNLVLLYSGGMDSFIIAHLYPDAKLLYIDSSSKYAKTELRSLPQPRPVKIVSSVFDFSTLERSDAIVPSRNLYFVTLAAEYGDTILLASTAGDNSTDKDELFAEHAGRILTHMYSSNHFKNRDNITVSLPGKHLSKGQLVFEYVAQGGDVSSLARTVSCYAGTEQHCGQCKACIRKWAALMANGIEYDDFVTHPREYNWTSIVAAINSPDGWRCADEDAYTLKVLQQQGVV